MNWDLATDIILYAALGLFGVFAALGLCQLIARKSLKKVDRELTMMLPPLVLMVAIYIIIDYFLILGTAPNNPTKPSFPSTHMMVVTTIFALTALALPRYVKPKPLRITLYIIMTILLILTGFGRIVSENHTPTDVAAGLVFGIILGTIYYLMKKEQK